MGHFFYETGGAATSLGKTVGARMTRFRPVASLKANIEPLSMMLDVGRGSGGCEEKENGTRKKLPLKRERKGCRKEKGDERVSLCLMK